MRVQKATASLQIFKSHPKKDICFNDPHSDIFLMFDSKIIPLHKEVIQRSQYLKQNCSETHKMIFLEQKLHFKSLLSVLASLYGHPLEFKRGVDFECFMQVVMFLEIHEIIKAVLEDIEDNFQCYGIFTLFDIATKYNFPQIQNKCLSELYSLNFQQLQINKYDLLKISRESFEKILQTHKIRHHKEQQIAQNLDIDKLIEQYNDTNLTDISSEDLFSSTREEQDECLKRTSDQFQGLGAKGTQGTYGTRLKNRKYTWNCEAIRGQLSGDVLVQSTTRGQSQSPEFYIQNQQQEKKLQIQTLLIKNKEILKSSNTMMSSLTKIKQQQQTKTQSQQKKSQYLQQKYKTLTNILNIQSEKLKEIESAVLQLYGKRRKNK